MSDSLNPDLPLVAGKYRVLRSLAAGGMGALYLAEHVELETIVVVKRLLELRDSEADVARFRREAKAAAALRSRHIVRVHDFGTDEQGPYLVMELLRGQDLCSLIEQRGALPVEQAVDLFRQAAKGMRVAHAAGVVHRDIKPSNLFLAEEEGEIVLKLLDFGIAKRFALREGSAAITASGMLLGSPGYMAPEQVRGQPVDGRADVWALGVVLYEMLTNAPPFYSEHVGDSLVRVCAGDYAPLTSLRRDLGQTWDEFFAHALSVDPDQRFQSVEVMLHALDLVQNGASDLSRLLVSAPTLKATSGALGSLPPSRPDGASTASARHPSIAGLPLRGPRTLDASQVPISEPTSSHASTRRLLWLGASALLLLAAGAAFVARPSNGNPPPALPPEPTANAATRAVEPALAPSVPPPSAATAHSPARDDGATESLPTAEPVRPAAAAGQAPRKTKARSAAPETKSETPSAATPPPTAPRSSQPKRDPFTGLVTE